ncbi:MAG: FkbM family methyltransferase [Candidatus Micrarchaeota archaeon]|nr:FkbM family methyltransferase [Candidatus Micrarchaeota archaeon]
MDGSNIRLRDYFSLIPNNIRLLSGLARRLGLMNALAVVAFKAAGREVVRLRDCSNIKVAENEITTSFMGRKVSLLLDRENERNRFKTFGEVYEQFVGGHYDADVRGKTVVDIGASIGDTAVYFALRGARMVYAFEPYPYSCSIAKRNIGRNGVGKRVKLINAGGSSRSGSVIVDPKFRNTVDDKLRSFPSGVRVPLYPLDEICRIAKDDDAVLKIDCEGCEYEIILNSSNKTLRKFSTIMLEYHNGYVDLERKLVDAGFEVSHTGPAFVYDSAADGGFLYLGDIRARRR